MFIPQAQVPDAANALNVGLTPIAWIVRTRGDAAAADRRRFRNSCVRSTGLPVSDVRTMDEIVSLSMSRQRFNMLLMSVFGGAALLLAAIGIYGLMAYSVAAAHAGDRHPARARRRPGSRQTMVVVQGMRLPSIGVVIGVASAFGLTRLIASFLFGVKALDPLVLAGIPLLLTAVALLAVWMPARRASRVDPLDRAADAITANFVQMLSGPTHACPERARPLTGSGRASQRMSAPGRTRGSAPTKNQR